MRGLTVPEELLPQWIKKETKAKDALVREFKQRMMSLYMERSDRHKVAIDVKVVISFK